ncbi:MAG: thioesterase family protein [Chloroflexota bacterium]
MVNVAGEPESYFVRVDEQRFRPTPHTGGAWTPTEQHFSPIAGLLTHAIDRFVAMRDNPDLAMGSITFDILGTVAVEAFDVRVEVVRAGHTIELLQAEATARGRPFVRARAWRLAREDTREVAGGEPERLPPPSGVTPWPLVSVWPGGYIASIEFRPIRAPEPGRTTAWLRTPMALVAGEQASPLARFIGLVDTANGIAVRVPTTTWFFPNVDLSIHLHRQPVGEWVGLDTTVVFGSDGHGVTSTILHDEDGPVGRAEQMLTIRRAD